MKKYSTKRMSPGAHQKPFEYQILLNEKVVWRGDHPRREYERLVEKHPHRQISIRWKGREGVLIAQVFFSL